MGLKIIENKTLEKLKERLFHLAEKSKALACYRKREEWLDNQNVCQLLNISPRTLQNYRDRNIVAYSMIGRKCYYKTDEIHSLVEKFKK